MIYRCPLFSATEKVMESDKQEILMLNINYYDDIFMCRVNEDTLVPAKILKIIYNLTVVLLFGFASYFMCLNLGRKYRIILIF